jgi:4'-phosphopantetheinyl transferase
MLNIYYLNINDIKFEKSKNLFWDLISTNRKTRIEKFKYSEDKIRCLFAEVVLKYALMKDFLIKAKEIHFCENSYGKPYLQDIPLFFSLSHSGNYVLCAVSNTEVGIDIEKHDIYEAQLANFFHSDEISHIASVSCENQTELFFKIWSLKESYIKYLGLGLSFPLKEFVIDCKKNDNISVTRMDGKPFLGKIQSLEINAKYASSICYNADKIDLLKQVSFMELKEQLVIP